MALAMTKHEVRAVAIYCRISQDRTGAGMGVDRQEAACRAYCERLGWRVVRVFKDNDISAYSGKTRPGYSEMLAAVERGEIDCIVVWHPDRLHRNNRELEDFIKFVDHYNVELGNVEAGRFDLRTPEGRLTARITGAVAVKESEDKSRRLRAKQLELAGAGKLSGGGHRPFGYERDRLTVRESEAEVIRQMALRLLAGESTYSLAAWLRENGIKTTTGRDWQVLTVKQMLRSWRYCGIRPHNDEPAAPAIWPAILTREQTERIRAILDNPARRTSPGNARAHLLSGFLRCFRCNSPLYIHIPSQGGKKEDRRRYGCFNKGHQQGACGKLTIVAPELEDAVFEMILVRLVGSTATYRALEGGAEPNDEAKLMQTIDEAQLMLKELATAYGDKLINMTEWLAAKKAPEARLSEAKDELVRLRSTDVMTPWLGNEEALRAAWPDMALSERRAVIDTMIDYIVIGPPAKKGVNRFDPGRVTPIWRPAFEVAPS